MMMICEVEIRLNESSHKNLKIFLTESLDAVHMFAVLGSRCSVTF